MEKIEKNSKEMEKSGGARIAGSNTDLQSTLTPGDKRYASEKSDATGSSSTVICDLTGHSPF